MISGIHKLASVGYPAGSCRLALTNIGLCLMSVMLMPAVWYVHAIVYTQPHAIKL